MLTLYTLPGAWGTRSLSPFCTKLEAWLLLAGVPYRLARAFPPQAPKGKVPYVRDGDVLLGDSQLVIRHLEETRGVSLDRHLDPRRAALAHLARRTIEEGTYYSGLWLRWGRAEAWPAQRAAFAPLMPPGLGWLGPTLIRRRVSRAMHAQGISRHAPDEIEDLAIRDVDALAAALGDDPFFGGEAPCTADLTLYAFADGVLRYPVEGRLRSHLSACAPLVAHRDRVGARLPWPAPLPG